MKTTILLFHPDYPASRANRALAHAAASAGIGAEVVDMAALYPDNRIDTDREAARLLDAERLVLQFPIRWYSTPEILQAWQDQVLTRMYYIRPQDEGERLRGLPVMVAATAGNVPEAYTPQGTNLFPLATLLRPLQATAHRCFWDWADPFIVYRADKSPPDELAAAGARYAARLQGWQAAAVPA